MSFSSDSFVCEDALRKILENSKSFSEFALKMMLSGEAASEKDCLLTLFKIIAFKHDSSSVSAIKHLRSASKMERNRSFFLDKQRLGELVRVVLSLLETDSISFFLQIYEPKAKGGTNFTHMFFMHMFLNYMEIVSDVDDEFIPSLRDSEGNNLPMIFVRALKFTEMMEIMRRTLCGNTRMEYFFYSNLGSDVFFKFLISKLKCDPYLKNKDGVCFGDFVSTKFLKEKLAVTDSGEEKE